MTRDDMIYLAKEAGFATVEDVWVGETRITDKIETLVAMVEAVIRRDCAQACYTRADNWKENAAKAAKLCGDAIMAKVKT